MTDTQIDRLEQLKRGTVEIYNTEELAAKLAESQRSGKPLRIKLGLDPTSSDIHLGHTVVLRKMRQFQDMGHKAVLIIGDYTARIGDPTGQNTTRPILSGEQIEANAATYLEQAAKILDISEEKFEIRYNSEWLEKMTLMELIQLAAKKTVAQMLQRDSFKSRLEKNIDVYTHEFIYPLMQGYDSVVVKSDIELGGTDQTFNNLVGRDIQRAYNQQPQIVMTMPILVGLDGVEKMSKSKGNYIGVTDKPADMFGKVMSISDDMMENYYTLLTGVSSEEIARLTDPEKAHPKEAKVRLGRIIVEQFYNEATAQLAAAEFEKVFAKGQLPDDMPIVKISPDSISAAKLLLECDLVETGGEGKRMIKQGGVSIDGKKINDPNTEIRPADGMVVQVGKRKFAKLKVR
ncbi:MAG: tyrosine--tRNA ligase [Phycisphaerae bacterium]|nr:tyrosine--tRNA ligase [Phycisphaerae bacterium]